jgi:phage integrase
LSVHKDTKRGTWYAKIKYTDWTGAKKETTRRGFARKKDAQLFEQEFLRQKQESPSMSFQTLYDIYMQDIQVRLRTSTLITKENLFSANILPFFGDLPCDAITPVKIRMWQNELVKRNYKPTYLRLLNNQLSAFFNYAVRFYGLPYNPVKRAGLIGKSTADAKHFWTLEDFQKFIAQITSSEYRICFLLLYWTGIRLGELLALSYSDFDLEKKIVHIRKNYVRTRNGYGIGLPKTPKSVREITLPTFLVEELKVFSKEQYSLQPDARLFEVEKDGLYNEMKRVSKQCGVEKIRIHDLRHSHASYLIHRGIPITAISARLGHENIDTTLKIYSHLYPQDHDIIIDSIESDVMPKGVKLGSQGKLS